MTQAEFDRVCKAAQKEGIPAETLARVLRPLFKGGSRTATG
jgi:hypothetical protein